MELFFIDEVKYSLKSRLSIASFSTRGFVHGFNKGVSKLSEALRATITAKTHIQGLSYFFAPRRAFIFLDIKEDFLSLKFYTGHEEIKGLQKGNWVTGGNGDGSKTFRIEDEESLQKALVFAAQSLRISINSLDSEVQSKLPSSKKTKRVNQSNLVSSNYVKNSADNEVMDNEAARKIILNAVTTTKKRWSQYDQSWSDIDNIFILHGYEQGGFHISKLVLLFEKRGIFSIDSLGSILSNYSGSKVYNRSYAGSFDGDFYIGLKDGKFGQVGKLFYDCTFMFLNKKIGNPGAFVWSKIWQMLISTNFLKNNYYSSFSDYIRSTYAEFVGERKYSDKQFLELSNKEWEVFLKKVKPWHPLYGIGQNVFDFIFGDIVEAQFVNNSFKFDSANQHFFRATGINDLIKPFDRGNTIQFIKSLDLKYTLREINKGIYTFCSKTEETNFGFCRSKSKCFDCGVKKICKQRI